jgi:hypothetical protein
MRFERESYDVTHASLIDCVIFSLHVITFIQFPLCSLGRMNLICALYQSNDATRRDICRTGFSLVKKGPQMCVCVCVCVWGCVIIRLPTILRLFFLGRGGYAIAGVTQSFCILHDIRDGTHMLGMTAPYAESTPGHDGFICRSVKWVKYQSSKKEPMNPLLEQVQIQQNANVV